MRKQWKINSAAKLRQINRTALQLANDEIALYAGDLSDQFLAGCFPRMMYIERSLELAEPAAFDLSMEADRLETRRMSAQDWLRFDLSLANGNLLARRYIQELDYEFVLVLDISRSMTDGWLTEVVSGTWRQHLCYRLKYLACALLHSAIAQNFACRVVFVDQHQRHEIAASDDASLPFAVLEFIDELIITRPDMSENYWALGDALRELADKPIDLLVAVLSDFLDPPQDHGGDEELMLSALSRLRQTKRLIVLQINRERDLRQSRLRPESLSELTYREEEGSQKFSLPETAERRARYCRWLGGTNGVAGRLETHLAMENVPFQKIFSSDDINARLEELAGAVLQV